MKGVQISRQRGEQGLAMMLLVQLFQLHVEIRVIAQPARPNFGMQVQKGDTFDWYLGNKKV